MANVFTLTLPQKCKKLAQYLQYNYRRLKICTTWQIQDIWITHTQMETRWNKRTLLPAVSSHIVVTAETVRTTSIWEMFILYVQIVIIQSAEHSTFCQHLHSVMLLNYTSIFFCLTTKFASEYESTAERFVLNFSDSSTHFGCTPTTLIVHT